MKRNDRILYQIILPLCGLLKEGKRLVCMYNVVAMMDLICRSFPETAKEI